MKKRRKYKGAKNLNEVIEMNKEYHFFKLLNPSLKTPKEDCPYCSAVGVVKSAPYTKDGNVKFYRPCKCTQ
jgi:hypothetical protein